MRSVWWPFGVDGLDGDDVRLGFVLVLFEERSIVVVVVVIVIDHDFSISISVCVCSTWQILRQ